MFDMLTSPYTHPLKKLIWMRMKASARAVYDTITGNPVTFSALAAPLKQLSVAFSPVQDLHGYDSPWPAGGGANLLPDISRTGTSGTMTAVYTGDSVVLTGTADGDGGRNNLRSNYFTLKAGTYYFKVWNENNHSKTDPSVFLQNGTSIVGSKQTSQFTLAEDSSLLNIGLNCSNGAEYNYSAQFTISRTDIQAYSPYENVCPISGWTGVNITDAGKNLLDLSALSMITCYRTSGADIIEQTRRGRRIDLPAGKYTFSGESVEGGTGYICLDVMNADGTLNTFRYLSTGTTTFSTATCTLTSGQYFLIFDQSAASAADVNRFENYNIMLNIGETAATYVPYDSDSTVYHVSFPAQGKNLAKPLTGYESYGASATSTVVRTTSDPVISSLFMVEPSTQYTFSRQSAGGTFRMFVFDTKPVLDVTESIDGKYWADASATETYTTPATAAWVFVVWTRNNTTTPCGNVQVEKGSSATAYEPFDNTIYSGWVDPTTGNGEITHIKQTMGDSVFAVTPTDNGTCVTFIISGTTHYITAQSAAKCLSNIFTWSDKAYSQMPLYTYGGGNGGATSMYFILPDTVTTKEEAGAWFTANPTDAIFQLATPVAFHVDPQSISPLEGDNTMWADVNGDLTVTYRSS